MPPAERADPWRRPLWVARQAVLALLAHRLRAALSTRGVMCGVASFLALIAFAEGTRRETLAQIEQLGLRNVLIRSSVLTAEQAHEARRRGSNGLTLADSERLRHALPGVASVAAAREVSATVSAPGRESAPLVLAVSPDFLALQGVELTAGRFLAPDDVRDRRLVCVIGESVARRLGPAGRPGETLRIGDSICRVVGVLRRMERRAQGGKPIALRDYDNTVALPLGAERAFTADGGSVTELIAQFRHAKDVLPGLAPLRRTLELAHRGVDDFRVIAPQELLEQAERAQRNFRVLMAAVAIIALLVGGIGITNTMLASVTERMREIGVRRAVGATRRNIAIQFLAEAILLTMAGGLAGLGAGFAAVAAADLAGWPAAVTAWSVFLPMASAIAVGIASGAYPALVAARMDPVTALRRD